ncbi:MAG TPA: DUF1206 domain-containing protein, partial [Rubrobacteraceae bacterium]|nr:DUF1206 domain-containing protein [Rubrobacteraceae bacterium]
MAQNGSSGGQRAKRVAIRAHPWIERLARFGYIAYGVVYALVGVLAVQAAFSGADQAAGQQGALRSVLVAPLGRILLCIIALGLLAYAAWRLYEGVMDPEHEARGATGIVKRLDHVLNGLFHGALAFTAGHLALGS